MHVDSEVMEKALSFDMSHILSRYAGDEDIPLSVAEEHERELKRFLTLCAMKPAGQGYGMRGPVDHLWHTFLTFSRDYQKFCKTLGRDFIHHVPEAKSDARSPESLAKYQRFLDDYEKHFGEKAPAHLWPRISSDTFEGIDCDGCTGCGVE